MPAIVPREIEPIYDRLGALVRSVRTKRGMSQEALGKALEPKVTRATVANIEAGHQRVFLHTALRLASVLDFDLVDFVSAGSPAPRPAGNTLANELAEKLAVPANRARSLARKIENRDQSNKP